jgi:thioredoxin 1
MAIDATKDTFYELVAEGRTIVDFWAEWCGPCRAIAPTLDQVSEEYSIPLVKLNIDNDGGIHKDFNVQGIPFVALFEDGEPVAHSVGVVPKAKLVESLGL